MGIVLDTMREILTPGAKLRRLRKAVRAKQQDLTGGGRISRALVSQIENEEVQLTEYAASIIVECLNEIAGNMKTFPVTVEYLMADEKEQVKQIADEFIRDLKSLKVSKHALNDLESITDEIDNFMDIYEVNPNQLVVIHELICDLYRKWEQWDKAIIHARLGHNAGLIIKDYINAVRLAGKIMMVDFAKGDFSQMEIVGMYCLSVMKRYKVSRDRTYWWLYYNLAIAENELRNFEKCLYYIDLAKEHGQYDERESYRLKILEANCKRRQGRYNEAEIIHLGIINTLIMLEDKYDLSMVYADLAYIYIKTDKWVEAQNFIELALSLQMEITPQLQLDILVYAIEIYIHLNNPDKVERYTKRALDISNVVRDIKKQYDILHNVIKYLTQNNYEKRTIHLMEIIENKVSKQLIITPCISNIYFQAARYLYTNNQKLSKRYFDKGFALMEKNYKNSTF